MCGKPVPVSKEAGIAEHVKKAGYGFVVEPSVGGIAEGIAQVIERNADWAELGCRGKEYAHQYLTWASIVDLASQCYREIAR